MTAAGWFVLCGGMLAVAIVLWPAGGTRWSMRTSMLPRPGRGRGLRPFAELAAAATAAVTLAVAGQSPVVAVAAALPAGMCVSALSVMAASRRWCDTAESVARLAAVLSNQAAVAVTAADALRRAAPLIRGHVGKAALSMAEDCEAVGVQAAAEGFAARVGTAAAQSLADLVAVSASSGGRWAATASVLEVEASEAAATARLFRSRVAGAMPIVIATLLLGAGIIVGAGWATRDVSAWLYRGEGTAVLLAASVTASAVSARVIMPARAQADSGGVR